jgi:hypothetical protein
LIVRPSVLLPALVTGLALAGASFAVADGLPDCRGYPVSLSVSPAQPGCDDVVTLGATQWLNDSCWTAAPPIFSADPPDFAFELASIDLWDSSPGCVFMILEIPFTREVGPLPAGPYSLVLTHTSTSPRHGDSACSSWMPFEVTCCAELPGEAAALQAALVADGSQVWLTWDDVPGGDDYVVLGSSEPDGPFTSQVQTAASGVEGVGLAIESMPAFFVVAARNECGVGPRR